DAGASRLDCRDRAFRIDQCHVLLGADKGCTVAEKMYRGDRRADRDRPYAVRQGDDGGPIAGIEIAHHVVMQLSKPARIACSGNSRPMKTRRLWRGSPSFHFRWWSPSSIMCTPWKT